MDILPHTPEHPLPDGRLTLLGAVESVTGAMTRVESGGATLLIDCGVAQGREARRWRFPDGARDADAVLLTHGHNDHVGSLTALVEGGFDGPIYGTAVTLDIADVVLSDGIRLNGGSKQDVARFRRRFKQLSQPIGYNKPFAPQGTRKSFAGSATFREAGHILGSASIELVSGDSRVVVSGDLGRPHSPILRDYETHWGTDRELDLVVMESTYGDREHRHTHDDIERDLERIIKRAVADGGHILIPAFAIGRTQTLLYHLNTLVEADRIPDLAVAVDTPMGLRVTEMHRRAQHLYDKEARSKLAHGDHPLDFQDLYAVKRGRDSARLRDVSDPMIIIAGSGMCTGGRIVGHLVELLPRPETCLIFVGFQAPGTPGRDIQQAARKRGKVRLGGHDVPVRASIETLSGLSAHADRVELRRWLSGLPQPRRVALHHGEVEAQDALASWLRADPPW